MRTYSYYYATKYVNIETGEENDANLQYGHFYVGVRVQDLLLKNEGFYKKLKLHTLSEIEPADSADISTVTLSNTSDALRLGIFEELTFTIVPIDSTMRLSPFNHKYNTGILYATSINRREIAQILTAQRFSFVSQGQTYIYKILLSTIKEKRQRKSAPTIG